MKRKTLYFLAGCALCTVAGFMYPTFQMSVAVALHITGVLFMLRPQ